MLKLENITKTYHTKKGAFRALNNICLSVEHGQLVVVQGPSGSGKTTLLLTAGTLLKPDSGSVTINDKNPYHLLPQKISDLRNTAIGFVFQQFYLIPYLNVRDNILAPLAAASKKNNKKHADELIAHFNLTQRANHFPDQLSTGERQRTALARALINQPKLILADEPTGNLDDANAQTVLQYLAEFAQNDCAVLIVTHDPKVKSFAHKTVNLVDGSIIEV